jgi:hypothetical protein
VCNILTHRKVLVSIDTTLTLLQVYRVRIKVLLEYNQLIPNYQQKQITSSILEHNCICKPNPEDGSEERIHARPPPKFVQFLFVSEIS